MNAASTHPVAFASDRDAFEMPHESADFGAGGAGFDSTGGAADATAEALGATVALANVSSLQGCSP